MTCKKHVGQSCFGGVPEQGWTIVASRQLTEEETKTFSLILDSTWYQTTIEYVGQPRISDWNPYKTVEQLKTLMPEVSFQIEHAHACNAHVAVPATVALVTQGRPERAHLYRWINGEEDYVANKFDDQRNGHDESLELNGPGDFWTRQIVQYLDRAEQFLQGARDTSLSPDERRWLEMKAQQAMVKCMMTAKGLVESSIRTFGNLPEPGHPSGEIRDWSAEV